MIQCDEKSCGMRTDMFVSTQFEVTRSYAQKLIEDGNVLVNGKPVPKNYKVKTRDEVLVNMPKPQPLAVLAQDIQLDIVYEDADIIVVNKPQGMVVHPAAGNYEGTLVNALMHHAGDSLSEINGVIRPGIVHRIDKDTSGLLMVAKNNAAHLSLAAQIKEHSIKREYVCLVFGCVKEDIFTVDKPIGRHPKERKKMAVVSKGGKHAVTHFSVLKRFAGYTLLSCRLETGRTHQIRVHLASKGFRIVGDPVYGLKKDKLSQKFHLKGQMLHAKVLGVVHPKTGEYLEFTSNLPQHFQEVIAYFEQNESL